MANRVCQVLTEMSAQCTLVPEVCTGIWRILEEEVRDKSYAFLEGASLGTCGMLDIHFLIWSIWVGTS